ncbi:MAG: anthranilate synthase component I [Candidatus Bathyarchaeia archaeon]
MFGYEPLKTATKALPKLKSKKISSTFSPFEVFSKIYKHCEYSYLLESMEGPRKLAQYSFIGFEPRSIIRVRDGEMEVCDRRGSTATEEINDPLPRIKGIVEGNFIPFNELRFIGGAVGYVSYDAVRYWENLPEIAKDDLNFPDIELAIYDDTIIFDHTKRTVFYYYSAEDRSKDLEELMDGPVEIQPLKYTQPETNPSKKRFEEAVMGAKEYIASGDVLQVVLSKRYEFTICGDLLRFYKSLRRINPSPYMYFLKMKDRQIVGSSPEMLVRVENGIVETYPIAGTRPRVKDKKKNRALARELLADPKERAEHIMLVDLARNDIGKVSEFGSVHVPRFMEVHEYSHVQHIVSRVIGRLRAGYDSCDVLKAIFPAGTVSGAPKVRAMEIIEEAEPTRRGPYAGAVGYFSFNGNSDFAITIRTLAANGSKAYIQVGAGIVADSIPEREWFETDQKARALMRALETSRDDQA